MSTPIEHLLSIKEASRLSGVPAYTLRFWEKEFQDFLVPPRTEGGQRRYDKTSLAMVERIKYLVDEEKYSIAGARGVLALEQQQREKRDDISVHLRNEEQIDLILDEIASIVREKVMSRLLREEGSNQVVGERVPGKQPQQSTETPFSASQVREATRHIISETRSAQVASHTPSPTAARFEPRALDAGTHVSHSPASQSSLVPSSIGAINLPNIAES